MIPNEKILQSIIVTLIVSGFFKKDPGKASPKNMISKETVDKIIDVARIEEVVSDFVRLKKRGVNMLGLCPFHDEKTPSFTVSPVKGIFKCFGCGKEGNALNFIMEHEKLTYPEALKYIAAKYHIPVEETENKSISAEEKTERDSLYIVLNAAKDYFVEQLNHTQDGKTEGLTYFEERGLDKKTISLFNLGWSHKEKDSFSKWAEKQGFKGEYLVKAGLSVQTSGGQLVDRFHGRIIFPIANVSGRTVGFGARILKSNTGEAKYINSPESELYDKSSILYGMDLAKKAIRQKDSCIVVEGYMDVISMVQAGVENVVASSGTSFTENQLKLIKRFTDNVVFLFDGDEAGQKASVRALNLALEQGMDPRVATLPQDHDPDTFAKAHKTEEIIEFIEKQSKNFISFAISRLSEKERTDPIEKAKALRELLQSVALIDDRLKTAVYIREIEKSLDIDEKTLYAQLRHTKIATLKNKSQQPEIRLPEEPKPSAEPVTVEEANTIYQEKIAIKAFLLYGDKPYSEEQTVAEYMGSHLVNIDWENEMCRVIFEGWQNRASMDKAIDELKTGTIENLAEKPNEEMIPIEPELDFSFNPEELEAVEFEGNMNQLKDFIPRDNPEVDTFINNLIFEKYQLSPNWTNFLGRVVVTPEDNYTEEVKSALNHLMLRKTKSLLEQNKKDIQTAKTEEETNELLTVHLHLSEQKKAYARELGLVIL